MNTLGYIYLNETTDNKDTILKKFLQSTMKKYSFFHKFLKYQQSVKQNENIKILMFAIPIISQYHINKASESINKLGVSNIIIQDCIEEYIENNENLIKFNMLKGVDLKEALISMALVKFLKRSPKQIEKSNVLLIVDSILKNKFENLFIDLPEFTIDLAMKSKNITLLFNDANLEEIDAEELNEVEELILDNTGLCPVCTFNLETAVEQDNQIIINLSKMKINYNELELNDKDCIIFDLNRNNNKKNNCISDYMVLPPKKYRNIELKEVYEKLVEGIFYIQNDNMDLKNIKNRNSISEYQVFLKLIKEQGFDIRLKYA